MGLFIFFCILYFMPALIAMVRETHNSTSLLIVNLLFGWTCIIWLIVLVLSLTSGRVRT